MHYVNYVAIGQLTMESGWAALKKRHMRVLDLASEIGGSEGPNAMNMDQAMPFTWVMLYGKVRSAAAGWSGIWVKSLCMRIR